MISKNLNGVIGYGYTVEETDEDCLITSVLQDTCNISSYKELVSRRGELSPWIPKKGSLHIHGIGYIKTTTNPATGLLELLINGETSSISSNMWETLYDAFYNKLNLRDFVLCSMEFERFFKEIGLNYQRLSSYPRIFPEEDVFEDPQIASLVITNDYTIATYYTSKVSIRRSCDSHYWSCVYSDNSFDPIDMLFFIAYSKGYDDADDIIKRGR